eukprot:TRINITY_DN15943_c0_g1_i1.p1 TRINITY_DN15943_c0_g1~~TRINITY_DN15943_c0_g1_i1.p1  ORF type:complete len:196 (+),score=65.42 TRINITY_DN15943_c0_g1_i1:77-664(+)
MVQSDLPELPGSAVKVTLNDLRQVRHALDDLLEETLTEKHGQKADNWMSDMKILLGGSAVLVSIYSHFVPVPFPENRWILMACAAAYFVLSSTMQFLISFVEKDVLFLSRPNSRGERLRVQTQVLATDYKVTADLITSSGGGISGHVGAFWRKKPVSSSVVTSSLGKFFDDRGVLYNPGFEKMVAELLSKLKMQA